MLVFCQSCLQLLLEHAVPVFQHSILCLEHLVLGYESIVVGHDVNLQGKGKSSTQGAAASAGTSWESDCHVRVRDDHDVF
jgi:hypothetical protein